MSESHRPSARVAVDEARTLAVRALENAGVPHAHAAVQTDLLVDGELRGHPSHGLLRLPRIIARIRAGLLDARTVGTGEWLGSAFYAVDGGQGLGPVVAREALEVAASRVSATGVVAVGIAANNHLGMLAWYAERMAQQNLACIAMTTSEALVHPYGGRRALVGTNPIAVGVPAKPDPFVLDMATGVVSMGRIHAHALREVPLEPGWALDANGEPTVDPRAALDGAIAPFGGAKGYGLGLAIEVLVASLTASALGTAVTGTLDAVNPVTKGDLFILLETRTAPDYLSDYLRQVRESGEGRSVLVPGDGSRMRRARALVEGIEIPTTLLRDIKNLAEAPRA